MQSDPVSAALRSIAIQHWLSIAAIVSALIVPIAGIALMRRAIRRRPDKRRSAMWMPGGCFLLLAYSTAAIVFGVCAGGQVGEFGKVRLVRALGAPVIGALDAYHRARGSYPSDLRELVPTYLSAADLHAPEQSPLQHPFEYVMDSGRYELRVRYAGPGMNTCQYRPGSAWDCWGLF